MIAARQLHLNSKEFKQVSLTPGGTSFTADFNEGEQARPLLSGAKVGKMRRVAHRPTRADVDAPAGKTLSITAHLLLIG